MSCFFQNHILRGRNLKPLLILWIFCLSVSLFSEERIDIHLRKNTSALLSALVSPVVKNEVPFPVHYINQLHVEEGGKLYVDSSSVINAKRIVLKPGSVIRTLGHSITIKTDEFIPGHFPEEIQGLSDDEKRLQMGSIDTRSHRYDGIEGQKGEDGTAGGDASQAYVELPHGAGEGTPGQQGGDGGDGKKAGSILLIVRQFRGGWIIACGGDGGSGGVGGNGGNGGRGYLDTQPHYDYRDVLSIGNLFLNGGNGKNGGNGGDGGSGGGGGSVMVRYEMKASVADQTLFIINKGGNFGRGGEGGMNGAGGISGAVQVKGDSHHEGAHLCSGLSGREGIRGSRGRDGRRGDDGPAPRFEKISYEVED